jgi:hypothetical protein
VRWEKYLFGIILISEKLWERYPRFINVFVAFIFQKPHLVMTKFHRQIKYYPNALRTLFEEFATNPTSPRKIPLML